MKENFIEIELEAPGGKTIFEFKKFVEAISMIEKQTVRKVKSITFHPDNIFCHSIIGTASYAEDISYEAGKFEMQSGKAITNVWFGKDNVKFEFNTDGPVPPITGIHQAIEEDE